MSPEAVMTQMKIAIEMMLTLSSPLLLGGLLVGLLVGVFQAVTQIQEMTLTFIPKIVSIFLALLFAFPWIMDKMITFTRELFLNLPNYIH